MLGLLYAAQEGTKRPVWRSAGPVPPGTLRFERGLVVAMLEHARSSARQTLSASQAGIEQSDTATARRRARFGQ